MTPPPETVSPGLDHKFYAKRRFHNRAGPVAEQPYRVLGVAVVGTGLRSIREQTCGTPPPPAGRPARRHPLRYETGDLSNECCWWLGRTTRAAARRGHRPAGPSARSGETAGPTT